MASNDFIDQVNILIRSGNGGAGSRHFMRARFIPKGGPDGGDGGKGGDIVFVGSKHLSSLLPFRYRKHIFAAHGEAGGAQCCSGANAEDVVLRVPLGTVIKDHATGRVCAEIVESDHPYVVAPGGRGGLGNAHFKSPTRQAPQYAQPGEKGVEMELVLELKLMADIGLVGEPNAGKSTLLATLSAARPKIASYPFTTLSPSLGVVPYGKEHSFVMADIPGLIEGAAIGKGLGIRFLRHIERNRVLLFLVPADSPEPGSVYPKLLKELEAHNSELLKKPRVIALTKIDLLAEKELKKIEAMLPKELPKVSISAATHAGIQALKDLLYGLLHKEMASIG